MPDFDRAQEYVYSQMRKLPSNLYYHGIHHTRNDVLPAAEKLGQLEGIEGEDMLLLKTAVLYHDLGYLEQYFKNEPIGVQMAFDTLPSLGYSNKQIGYISRIIMATQLNSQFRQDQNREDLLQLLMCDADLDSLGRDDFFVVGENLRRELGEYGLSKSVKEWFKSQLNFQKSHSYFTSAAQKLRNAGKHKNILELEGVLGN